MGFTESQTHRPDKGAWHLEPVRQALAHRPGYQGGAALFSAIDDTDAYVGYAEVAATLLWILVRSVSR